MAIVRSSSDWGCKAAEKLITQGLIRIQTEKSIRNRDTHYLFITPEGKRALRLWREFQEAFGFKADSILGDVNGCTGESTRGNSLMEKMSILSLRGDELFYILGHAKPGDRKKLRYVRLGCVKKFLTEPQKEKC